MAWGSILFDLNNDNMAIDIRNECAAMLEHLCFVLQCPVLCWLLVSQHFLFFLCCGRFVVVCVVCVTLNRTVPFRSADLLPRRHSAAAVAEVLFCCHCAHALCSIFFCLARSSSFMAILFARVSSLCAWNSFPRLTCRNRRYLYTSGWSSLQKRIGFLNFVAPRRTQSLTTLM